MSEGKEEAVSADDGENEAEISEKATVVEAPSNGNNSKRRRNISIGVAILLVAVVSGVVYWLYARQYESTDDAFIEGDIVQVSPKVAAYILKVDVESNQFVHKGDLLVELDPTDLQVKLEQAKANLENARSQRGLAQANASLTSKTTVAGKSAATSNVTTAKTNVEQTRLAAEAKRSQITQAQAAARTAQANLAQTRAQAPQVESNVRLAQTEYNRRLALFKNGDISQQALDQATNALQSAEAELNAAQKQISAAQSRVDEANAGVATAKDTYRQSLAQVDLTQSQVDESKGRLQDAAAAPERIDVTKAQVGTAEAQIAAAEVAVHQAEIDLTYTKIVAPSDGYVTRKTIEEGQLVQIGTPLMAISQADEVWVIANFKETQLENMRAGQPVDIKVDAYPNQTFKGKVESFQAGTGSRFSILPPENATGNYVKVVQRVPVKIVFDEQPDSAHLLAPGMSVEPVVKVR
ncbi:MAG: efflux RND transporter periplasmic adaptor subunit [Acidobacteriota bacterium]